jgi:hypothetical protein
MYSADTIGFQLDGRSGPCIIPNWPCQQGGSPGSDPDWPRQAGGEPDADQSAVI